MLYLPWLPAGLLLASWMSPLHVLPWMSWENELWAIWAVIVACAMGAWRLRREGGSSVRVPALVLFPLLIVLVAVIQWAVGRIAYGGTVLTVASYAFVCCAAATLGRRVGEGPASDLMLDMLAKTTVIGGLLQLIVVFGQVFSLWPTADWIARTGYQFRAGGNFAQPNQAALLFVMGMCSAAFLIHRRQVHWVLGGTCLLSFVAGIATTQSRSGLLAVFVLAVGYMSRRHLFGGGRAVIRSAGLVVVALILFTIWPSLVTTFWGRPMDGVNVSTSGRSLMWAQFLHAVRLHPWFGWGVTGVAKAQNAVADRFPEVMAATFSHNVLLDLVLWAGIPVAALFAIAGFAWLLPRLRAAQSIQSCYGLALLIPLLTQSLTEFPYAYTFFLAPIFFALGILEGRYGRPPVLHLRGSWAIGSIILAAALHIWAMGEYIRIEEDFRVARFEALRVGAAPSAHQSPRIYLLTQLDALARATRLQPRPGMTAGDLQLFRNVAMQYPWGATYFRYGLALALNGDLAEARRQFAVFRATQGSGSYARMLSVLDEMTRQYPILAELRLPR